MNTLRLPIILSAIIAILIAGAGRASAQRTTRKGLARPVSVEKCEITGDTVAGSLADSLIMVTGYEKPLRASRESVFILNRSDRELLSIRLEISYFTGKNAGSGTLLHKREVELQTQIPAGERRMVWYSSWDRNQVFYYHVNTPGRTRRQATPYSVTIRILTAVFRK